jgi:organic hydroperoxide reductase OsmC/OhrA
MAHRPAPFEEPPVQPFPHHYIVSASAEPEGDVAVASAGLEPMRSAPPVEFGGPGVRWSPESLLCGALADCFVLTFRAIARASKLAWLSLDVEVLGTLEREDRNSRFTRFDLQARLRIPVEGDPEAAERALHKAEAGCLISNSLTGQRHLVVAIEKVAAAA